MPSVRANPEVTTAAATPRPEKLFNIDGRSSSDKQPWFDYHNSEISMIVSLYLQPLLHLLVARSVCGFNKTRISFEHLESKSHTNSSEQVRLSCETGGWGAKRPARVASPGSERRGCQRTTETIQEKIEALVRSTASSARPDAAAIAAEGRAVKLFARRISENSAEIEGYHGGNSRLLKGDDTCRCLLTVPGIGPKTASELAIPSISKTSPATTGSLRSAAWRRATASRGPRSPR